MAKKLTKTIIEAAEPADAEYSIWCGELPAFGIRVLPSGRKIYVIRYRTVSGRPRKMKLGRTCDMSPDKARELAKKLFQEVAEGKDPAGERHDAKVAPTVLELKERYTDEHAGPFKKAASQRSDEKNWRLYILPAIGKKKVAEVTHADVLKLFGSLSKKRATANQVLALLSKSFNLAETWGYRQRHTNPCEGAKKFDIAEKECVLNPAQITNLNATLIRMTVSREITGDFADFIRLLMLTGCRKSEIMHARAEWIDLHQGLLILPDSKTGHKKVLLSGPSYEIAEALVKDGREWLIPGRHKTKPLQTPYKVWKAVKLAAGLPKELRLHDLRHTAGTLAHMAGATQKEIQKLLHHKQMSTTERYIHAPAGSDARTLEKLAGVITGSWSN